MEGERFSPTEENLGQNCLYWRVVGGIASACRYPKAALEGRRSCEGIIDDVCLFVKDGRRPTSLSEDQIIEIKTRPPSADKFYLPPGNIT